MISRSISPKLSALARSFPVVALVGPRQSGKTTLVQSVFADKPYVSLENLDTREYAIKDPRGFLADYPRGAVLDEIQRVPQLFSYLQATVDEYKKPGMFILTGSQHFLLQENLSQSLAGRVAILKLLPLSMMELKNAGLGCSEYTDCLFTGFYPGIYNKKINPLDWYLSYIQTYLERDVRLIKNIGDLGVFQTFLKMCASRIGSLVNLSALANDCGITHNTAKAWLAILEASFVVYFLRPHHKNFNKRLIKMPKLYFYDTGLASCLLGIEDKEQLKTHALKGNLFEALIITEILKHRYNLGLPSNIYFWRDRTGHEIDCLVEKQSRLVSVEIKSGQTMNDGYCDGLNYWASLSGNTSDEAFLVYGGNQKQQRGPIQVLSWRDISPLFK